MYNLENHIYGDGQAQPELTGAVKCCICEGEGIVIIPTTDRRDCLPEYELCETCEGSGFLDGPTDQDKRDNAKEDMRDA